jgi:chromosome segregation ATPase
MGRRTVAALVVAVFCGAFVAARAQTQSPAASHDIMPALLAEVRGLREAMEQMASGGARVQLALGRVQLQEQRLNTAIRRLEETRTRLAQLQRTSADQQDQLAMMETAIKENREHVPAERHQVEQMLRHHRRQIARAAAEVQQLTLDEAALANDVANEQARWNEYNVRLEELERTLGRR